MGNRRRQLYLTFDLGTYFVHIHYEGEAIPGSPVIVLCEPSQTPLYDRITFNRSKLESIPENGVASELKSFATDQTDSPLFGSFKPRGGKAKYSDMIGSRVISGLCINVVSEDVIGGGFFRFRRVPSQH